MEMTELGSMVAAYVETALWSETDDYGEPLDANYIASDIDPDTAACMEADCRDFASANIADLADMSPGHAGHDFWLTRNRHGAGFWDRGLGALGERLTENAHPYGTYSLYVGDDGKIYGD